MSHRPSLSLVLTIFISVSLGLVFFWLSGILLQGGVIEAPSSRIYLTLVGISLGYLSTQPTVRLIKLFTRQILAKTTIRTQINFPSVFLGTVLGLLSTVYIDHVLTLNNAYDPYRSGIIALALTLAFYWLSATLIRRFTFIRTLIRSLFRSDPILTDSKVLDTSALIDGRLNSIITSHFLEPPFLVPNFVVKELQNLADTSEPLKRQRGRAGLGLTLWSEEGKLLGQSPQVRGAATYTDVFLLTVIGPISFTDLDDIRTSGRFVKMGEDKWGQFKRIED